MGCYINFFNVSFYVTLLFYLCFSSFSSFFTCFPHVPLFLQNEAKMLYFTRPSLINTCERHQQSGVSVFFCCLFSICLPFILSDFSFHLMWQTGKYNPNKPQSPLLKSCLVCTFSVCCYEMKAMVKTLRKGADFFFSNSRLSQVQVEVESP